MYFFFALIVYCSEEKDILYSISFSIMFCGTVAKDWLMSIYISQLYIFLYIT